jgi:Arc/MetJ family transcription regulator
MRTTLNIDDELMAAARKAVGVESKTRVIEMGLRALVEAAARQRLAALHGALPTAKAPPRRRPRRRSA